jgi:hypothetical protein
MTEPEVSARPPATSRLVDFGPGVLIAAVAVLVLLLAAVLPWTGSAATGWDVVRGASGMTVLPRLFGTLALVFGAVGSLVCLATRRWVAVLVVAGGCAVTSVTGLWAVWSQNTIPGNGPGAGLFLALASMIVLAFRWASYAISRD